MEYAIPEAVRRIIGRCERAGYEAWAVGGCVRDLLLGRTPHDWDICTSARPEQVMALFPGERFLTVGMKHGTVLLMLEGMGYEITTFRSDGAYADHRHPDSVTFVPSLREDLARRDFTINAMALHPERGLTDCFGGQSDLKAGIIRCVGEPERRFEEDALRILRGMRFASRFGYTIEESTAAAMEEQAPLLNQVAGERIWSELLGFFEGDGAGELLLRHREVFAAIMPELRPMFDHPQYNPHHCYDVWEHTCRAVMGAAGEPLLGVTMLLHDSGKPACFTRDGKGIGHFHGHPEVSAQLAEGILTRFRCDSAAKETILTLIRWHDRVRAFTRRSVRRLLAELGEERTRLLFRVMRADAEAQNPATVPEKRRSLAEGERILEELLAEHACVSLKELAVDGRDLIALGYTPGPALGAALEELLEAALEERVPNEREALLALAKENFPANWQNF